MVLAPAPAQATALASPIQVMALLPGFLLSSLGGGLMIRIEFLQARKSVLNNIVILKTS